MINLKPLIDAVAFVRANPDKFDQEIDYFNQPKRCIISYAATNVGQESNFTYPDLTSLAEVMGVSYDELNIIHASIVDNEALDLADELIAKYTPVKYPVGTKLRGNYNKKIYTIVGIGAYDSRLALMEGNTGTISIFVDSLDRAYTIVEDEVTPDFEYVVTFKGNHNVVATFDDADSAKIAARAIVAYREQVNGFNEHPVKVIQRPTKPAEVEVDF